VRLEQLKDEYVDRVELSWRSFLLRPQAEERSPEKFREYTQRWQGPASQPDGGRFRPWSTDEPPPSHSVPPNVAVKAAARQGAFDRYHLAVMDEYFFNNRNVTDPQTLIRLAGECGLDVERFTADFRSAELEREVVRDYQEALSRGITAVPTVVVDDEWQIPGAQDLTFYRRMMDRRLAIVAEAGSE
jgi:predicted DsbA family dithiol-disulfide isomerase